MPCKRVGLTGRSPCVLCSLLCFLLCFLTKIHCVGISGIYLDEDYQSLILEKGDLFDITYSGITWSGENDGHKIPSADGAIFENGLFFSAIESLKESIESIGDVKILSQIEDSLNVRGRVRYFLVIPKDYHPVSKSDLLQRLKALTIAMDNVFKTVFVDDIPVPDRSHFNLSISIQDFGGYEVYLLNWFSLRGRKGEDFLFKYIQDLHPDLMLYLDQPLVIYPSTDMKPEDVEILDKLPQSEPPVQNETLSGSNLKLSKLALRADYANPDDLAGCEPYNSYYIRYYDKVPKPAGSAWSRIDAFGESNSRISHTTRDLYRCRITARAQRYITCGYNNPKHIEHSKGLVYMFDSGMSGLDPNICHIVGRSDARMFSHGKEERLHYADDMFSNCGHGTLMGSRVACSNVAVKANNVYSIKVYSGNITDEKDITYMYVSSYMNGMYQVYNLCKDKVVPDVYHDAVVFLFGFTWIPGSERDGTDHDRAMKVFTELAIEMCKASVIVPAHNPVDSSQPINIVRNTIYPKKSTKGTVMFDACDSYPRKYSNPKFFHIVGSLGRRMMATEKLYSFEALGSGDVNSKHISPCIDFYGRGEYSLSHCGSNYLGSYTKARGSSMAAADVAAFFASRIPYMVLNKFYVLGGSRELAGYPRTMLLQQIRENSIIGLKGTLASYFSFPIEIPPPIPGYYRKDCMRAAAKIYNQIASKYSNQTYTYPYEYVH